MSRGAADVSYSIGADTSKYDRAMAHVRSEGGKVTDGLIGRFTALSVAGTAAFAAITAAAIDGFRSYAEFDRIQRRTEALIRATGNAAGITANEMVEFAKSLDLATLGDRNQILESINALQTFKSVQGDVFKRTIELSQDLAEALGVDLKGQTIQLGKALEDPIRGLSALAEVGVSFTDTQRETIKNLVASNKLFEAQSTILDTIAGQVGGAAGSAAGGIAGQLDTLNDLWRDLKESMAGSDDAIVALSAINSALQTMIELTEEIPKNISMIDMALSAIPGGALITGYKNIKKLNKSQQYGGGFDPMAEGGAGFSPWLPSEVSPAAPKAEGEAKTPKDILGIFEEQNAAKLKMVEDYYNVANSLEAEQIAINENNRQQELQLWIEDLEAKKNASELFAQKEAERQEFMVESRKQAMRNMVSDAKFAFNEFGKQSDIAFGAYQATAVSETLVNTYKGAQAAFTALAGIPIIGPTLGTAAAVAATAAGLARARSIASMKPGGGASGGGGGGGAVGTYSTGTGTSLPETDPAYAKEEKKGSLTINIQGDVIGEDEWLDNLVSRINDASDRDVVINNARVAGEVA